MGETLQKFFLVTLDKLFSKLFFVGQRQAQLGPLGIQQNLEYKQNIHTLFPKNIKNVGRVRTICRTIIFQRISIQHKFKSLALKTL